MTTIAADLVSGLMVCDTQWTDGSEKGRTRKVYRIRGELVGFAGDNKAIEAAVAWFKRGKEGPSPRGDVAALILNGRLSTWEPQNGFMDQGKRFAIGSGGAEARAAMEAMVMCGLEADPAIAVKAACEVDAQSGKPVRKYRLSKQ